MMCPFCEIDYQKTKIIQINQWTYVVFSNPRITPGHLLVIPKRHVERLSQLTANERRELGETVITYQEKIIAGISPGCDI